MIQVLLQSSSKQLHAFLQSTLQWRPLAHADCTPSASEVFQTMAGEVAGVPAGAASGMPAGQPAAEQNLAQDGDPTNHDGSQCAAVLDGGMDQITPVQIWNAVMTKYKLAQRCEQELSRLGNVDDGTKREQLLQERALAVAAAVQALADLHHRETIAKLQDLKRLDQAPGARLDVVHSKDF